jgi:UDP-N-acetylmuramoyl-tripeptide--D-alanyl-D-alanine ligase
MMTTLGDARSLIPGAVVVGEAAVAFDRVHTDTRTLRAGDLFVALRGERFDGHDFLAAARAAGAVAAIAEGGLAAPGAADAMPGLQVPDTLVALQALAAGWRARWLGPLLAVTGSNGKTTVTQMLASIARAAHGPLALATEGNLNNHIGVPLTLLGLRLGGAEPHAIAVLELGTNHPGEIALLARIAAPTVALINNAQREHQEFLDGIEAVARENGSVIEALPADGVAVFPADDAMTPLWRELAGARRVVTFARLAPQGAAPGLPSGDPADAPSRSAWGGPVGRHPLAGAADVHARAVWDAAAAAWQLTLQTPVGDAVCRLALPGLHNVDNALAATATALAAGIPLAAIAQGLEAFQAVGGRSRVQSIRLDGRAVTLVDDSYNANPDSVRAAIDLLAALPGPRWMLLGDMAEVGSQGPAFHAEVGAWARQRGLDALWCVGPACATAATAAGPIARHFADVESARAVLDAPGARPAAASVLVKGSRSMRMERLVQALQTLQVPQGSAAAPSGATSAAPRLTPRSTPTEGSHAA